MKPSLEKIKADTDHPIHGLLATLKTNVQHLEGSWQFQVFNNLDEFREGLRGKVSETDLARLTEELELLVKKPLRRQMGRIKAIARSIDELYRYLS